MSKLRKAKLVRYYTSQDVGTLGKFSIQPSKLSEDYIDLGYSLECYHNEGRNTIGVDAIPAGTYLVEYLDSPRFKRKMYRLKDVEGRSGILFHVANYGAYYPITKDRKASELEGCISLGSYVAKTGKVLPRLMLAKSRVMIDELERLMGGESFMLTIEDGVSMYGV